MSFTTLPVIGVVALVDNQGNDITFSSRKNSDHSQGVYFPHIRRILVSD